MCAEATDVTDDAMQSEIIVPLDGGQVAERAIPVATALAARAGLPLTFVTVLSDADPEDNANLYLEARQDEVPGASVRCDVLHGFPAINPLVEYLGRRPGSLVCCSTHARPDSKTFRLGSFAEALVRRSPVPVLLVGPVAELPEVGSRYEDVVVCVEGESACRLVTHVRELSRRLGLNPSLLQVIEPSYGAFRREDARQVPLLESLSREFAADTIVVDWDLVEDRNVPLAIATAARQRRAPLLALSSRRRYPDERFEETSMTVAIARIASCPVLVVGPAVAVPPSDRYAP